MLPQHERPERLPGGHSVAVSFQTADAAGPLGAIRSRDVLARALVAVAGDSDSPSRLRVIAREAALLLGAQIGTVGRIDGSEFVVEASWEADGGPGALDGQRVPIDHTTVPGRALLSGRTMRSTDLEAEGHPVDHFGERDRSPRSAIAVPVRVRGELWGHLGAVSWEVGAFEERHEPTLEGLAGILGLAIEAAQAPSVDEVDPDRAVREAVAAAAGLGRISALLASGIWNSVPETAFDRYTRLVGRVVDAPVALLSLVGGDSQVFKSRVSPDPLPESTPLSHSFCKHVAADDAPLVVTDARLDPILESNRAVEDLSVISYLGVPVHDPAGRAIGALCAIDSVPRAWSDEDVEALTDLSAAVSTEIALRSTMASSEQRARTDELTGVWNRRQLEDAVEFRAVASAAPLGGHLLLFDVDDFKRVNDTHGHRAGDCVLREVARRTSSVLRASDTIARWGGDEFVVVLDHDPGKAEALEVAERVLAAVSGAPFALPDGADLEVSVSIGVSRWGPEDELAEVFERSDRALIEAKRGGRNRVVAVD